MPQNLQNIVFPYGMLLQGRQGSVDNQAYRYAFQGQERDDEVKGEGNSYNYKYRMHDPRSGRFFAVDPLAAKYPHNSVYAFSENSTIAYIELEGLEKYYAADGKLVGSVGDSKEIRVLLRPRELMYQIESHISNLNNLDTPDEKRKLALTELEENSLTTFKSQEMTAKAFSWRFTDRNSEHAAGIFKLKLDAADGACIDGASTNNEVFFLSPVVSDGMAEEVDPSPSIYYTKVYEVLSSKGNQIKFKMPGKLSALIHTHPAGDDEFSTAGVPGLLGSDKIQSIGKNVPVYISLYRRDWGNQRDLYRGDFHLDEFADKVKINTSFPEGFDYDPLINLKELKK